ncbi:sensor domain-containing protein [Mycobacterium sp. SMC-4]|nr:sensor domain-containing protein [Mycobacterium sp. SMC-4]
MSAPSNIDVDTDTHIGTDTDTAESSTPRSSLAPPLRTHPLGVVPSASLLVGGVLGSVWFWIPLTIFIIGISSIPSVIGFVLSAVVFVYLIRGIEHVERVRSEAVFGMGLGVPPRRRSPHTGFQGWAHQLWLDVSSSRFWKAAAHHYLRMAYDIAVTALALLLLTFAFLAPAGAVAIGNSDAEAGLSFLPTPLALLLAVLPRQVG